MRGVVLLVTEILYEFFFPHAVVAKSTLLVIPKNKVFVSALA